MTHVKRSDGKRSVLIPEDLDERLEQLSPPEYRGDRKASLRVTHAVRQYLANVTGQAGTNEQVAAAGDERPKPVSAGSR